MAKDWSSHNNKVFKKGLDKFVKKLKVRLYLISQKSAAEVMVHIQSVEDTDEMPVWTGNMIDGTGFGIYQDSKLTDLSPPKTALSPQEYEDIKDIWGTEYLGNALQQGVANYPRGIWLVLVSAVPYAEKVDASGSPKNRGRNFFDMLISESKKTIELNLKTNLPNAKIR